MATWDDGKHTLVRKVQISYGSDGINSIKVDYDSNGNLFAGAKHGGNGDKTEEISLNYPGEYLTSVTGYYTTTNSGDVVTALTFKTNKRTLGPYGNKTRKYFSIDIPKDNQIVGFKGKSGNLLNELEVHYGPIASGPGSDGLYGGRGGLDWDDKDEYSGVLKFEIGYDNSVIHSITVTYDQTGSTIPAQRRGGTGGTVVPLSFNFPGEYLVSVSGTYSALSSTSSDAVIKSLTLVTNRRQYGPYGQQTGTAFTLSSPNKQIIGFKGRSGAYLDAIGAYYGPIPDSPSPEPVVGPGPYGSAGGLDWNDGDEYSGVKKIEIGYDNSIIHSITVEYDQTGSTIQAQRRGGDGGNKIPIQFKYPEEYLVSVSGTYSDAGITSLTLETNKKPYGPYGKANGQAFKLTSAGKQIIGFRGTSGAYLNTLGAYFGPFPDPPSAEPVVGPGPYGSAGGIDWNDRDEYSGVKKIEIGYDNSIIHSITVEYDQTGSTIQAQRRGGDGGNKIPIKFNYPDEYLVSVSGTYSDAGITSLTLETNKKPYGPYGKANGQAFKLTSAGKQIIGFRGTSGAYLNTLGAYFGPFPDAPSAEPVVGPGPYGSTGGIDWNDRDEYSGVKKIEIGYDNSIIHSITVEYDQTGSTIQAQRRGGDGGNKIPVKFNYPDEFLVSVSGTFSDVAITSLTLQTNKTTYGPYGKANGNAFKLTSPDTQIIGFRGTSGAYLNTLGAYFGPPSTPVTPTSEKLEAYGGNGGIPWDDGEYDTVRKIYVGDGPSGIHYIKFEYEKNGQPVEQEHGKKNIPPVEVALNYPNEYLTSMEGYYDNIPGFDTPVIQSLKFKTNKGNEHGPFGFESGTRFSTEDKAGKIIGFHGRSSDVLHKLGVYVKPASS